MTRRTEQAASVLHRAVQTVIHRGLADPRIDALITVTGVSVSDDLADATISVSIMPGSSESKCMHALRDAAGYIRRESAELLSLRRVPRLSFRVDRGAKRQAEVLRALADIAGEAPAEAGRAEADHSEEGT